MRSEHLNVLFGTGWYVVAVTRFITLENCRTLASGLIAFSIKSEDEIDET
jgi:hypothetical protein